MRILNVDDNAGGRYAKSRALQRAGFTVLEAASGNDALRLLATEKPHLVLLDVKLPDISGFEVCRRIKLDPQTASTMVVQTSAAFIAGQDRVRGLEGGADAYLTEPVQPEELVATVKAMQRLWEAEDALRQARDTLEVRVQERTAELERTNNALQQEIAERKRAEEVLQASQQFLQSTLDALSSHIAILDDAGMILDTNASWLHFAEANGSAASSYGSGRSYVELFTAVTGAKPADAQTVAAGVRAVLAQQRDEFSCEYACHHHSEPRWFVLRATRFGSPAGARTVVVHEDVTEIKQAEAQLQHQQEMLFQSEKLAAMGSLLASVAHELNNPLAIVKMQADVLSEELQDSALQERIVELLQGTERCIRIVQNFLTLAHRNPPRRTPVELNTVVAEALQLLDHALQLDEIVVRQHLAQDLPLLGANPSQLQQVVVNLLLNAQQALHTVSGPRQVTLTTRYEPAQARVWLEVADSGPGIPPELQARVFEPFYTTKPVGIGTGLGLALCQSIVEGHGGAIHVMSPSGRGTVFRVELPVEATPVSVPDASESVDVPPLATPATTILIVDDELSIARGLARLLQRDGHHVETAANGRQALTKLQEQDYNLILCDLRMPELDGPGLYWAVASQQPHLLQRFIFLTGDTLSPEAGAFLDQTGVPRLIKPFSAAESRRAVRQALQAQR